MFFLFFFRLHDDTRFRNRLADGLVRQDVGAVQVELVIDKNVLTQNRHVLHADLTGERTQSAGIGFATYAIKPNLFKKKSHN